MSCRYWRVECEFPLLNSWLSHESSWGTIVVCCFSHSLGPGQLMNIPNSGCWKIYLGQLWCWFIDLTTSTIILTRVSRWTVFLASVTPKVESFPEGSRDSWKIYAHGSFSRKPAIIYIVAKKTSIVCMSRKQTLKNWKCTKKENTMNKKNHLWRKKGHVHKETNNTKCE